MLGPFEGLVGGQDAPDGFAASGCNADPSGAKTFFADAGDDESQVEENNSDPEAGKAVEGLEEG